MQLTIADFVAEIHDTHHPIGNSLYYEEQKREAKRRSEDFRRSVAEVRRVLRARPATQPGARPGTRGLAADLCGSVVGAGDRGLALCLSVGHSKGAALYNGLRTLHDRVFAQPRIKRYVESKRRLAFNNDDIFRRYPALDG